MTKPLNTSTGKEINSNKGNNKINTYFNLIITLIVIINKCTVQYMY